MPVNVASISRFVAHLDTNPEAVQPYAKRLETTIAGLMDATFESVDSDEETRLAALELRCRLVSK